MDKLQKDRAVAKGKVTVYVNTLKNLLTREGSDVADRVDDQLKKLESSLEKFKIMHVKVSEATEEVASEEELEKVRTEARILARCKHNNIIRYKDHFMIQPPLTMCLVMEYADGGKFIVPKFL